ncbi:DMT family transporter [Pontibacillus litoralis]|uniref:EamA domain-containing protein n=1 Tax=Pontibacillus litoralis JSM 072002 TaxID=1385512 RepID=A0A0A5G670_9BACI|nr:DMT family transporter [Pontibacillus litoralis]KGX87509.1 hypothetical protein N784_14785 [Pontibacillus litoralis JSM 072002]
MGILYALLSALMFSINNVIVKKGIMKHKSNDNGLLITVFINVVLLGVIYLVMLYLHNWQVVFSWSGVGYFALAGLCTTGIGRLTLFRSIAYIGPTKASAIRNTTPIFTTLFAVLFLNETIGFLPSIGILLMLGGVLLESFRNYQSATPSSDVQRMHSIGFRLAICAAIIFGIGQGIRKQGLIVLDDAFLGAWIGALASLLFVVTTQGLQGTLVDNMKASFRHFSPHFLIAGILTSFGPLFFFLATKSMQVSYVSVIAAIEPLLTMLISAIVMRNIESISVQTKVMVVLVVAGTILLTIHT